MQLNLALVGLLNVSLALEDPFDNQGLDGIYVDEALFEAEQVRPTAPCLVLWLGHVAWRHHKPAVTAMSVLSNIGLSLSYLLLATQQFPTGTLTL